MPDGKEISLSIRSSGKYYILVAEPFYEKNYC